MRNLIKVILMISMFNNGFGQTLPANLVVKGAEIEKVASGYSFTEGSSTASDGSVYFTDQPNDRIYRWTEENGVSLFMEGTQRSNGTYFDMSGNLISCADLNNSLVKITMDRKIEVIYAQGYDSRHFNGPNDLWINPAGGIYFTDPYYHRNYWDPDHKQLLDVQGVYYLDTRGKLTRVISDLQQPNGITGTPDGRYLYVADIKDRKTWKYKINTDGSLSEKTLFAEAGSDGMTIDTKGNIYLTSGKVLIFNSKGEKTGEIELPESPSNLCFAGTKRNILFITARTSVYTLKMKVRGVE